MNICLFSPEEINHSLDLRDERAKHILSVLHKGEGDSFAAGIIGGEAGEARIEKISRREMTAPNGKSYNGGAIDFTFTPLSDGKKLHPLIMLIGFPRPIQLKRLLRDMAGLGVCSVYLTATELTEKSYLKSSLSDEKECYKMLLEGTVQAASTHVPQIKICTNLQSALEEIEGESQAFNHTVKLAMDNIHPQESISSYLIREGSASAESKLYISAIGSERGWTDREREILVSGDFKLLSMGSRVLRTESAATVSASLILSAMGVL